jgi:hypothetical protein
MSQLHRSNSTAWLYRDLTLRRGTVKARFGHAIFVRSAI